MWWTASKTTMCCVKNCLFLLLSILIATGHATEDDFARIAECRAQCLDKFYLDESSSLSDAKCKKVSDCHMCWDFCGKLFDNFHVWGPVCTDEQLCACGFHAGNEERKETNPSGNFAESIRVKTVGQGGVVIEWDRPERVSSSSKLAYVVMRRTHSQGNEDWKLVAHTSELMATEENLVSGKKYDFKVMAVDGSKGVVATSAEAVYSSNFAPQDDNSSQKMLTTESTPESWHLTVARKLSLVPNSVELLVSWIPVKSGEQYMVVWEAEEGGLDIKGRLQSEVTSVSITLETGRIYFIHVELAGSDLRSESLQVNTGKVVYANNQLYQPMVPSLSKDLDCEVRGILAGLGTFTALFLLAIAILLLKWYFQSSSEVYKLRSAMPIEISNADIERADCTPHVTDYVQSMEKLNNPLSPVYAGSVFVENANRITPPPYEIRGSMPLTPHESNAPSTNVSIRDSGKSQIFHFEDQESK